MNGGHDGLAPAVKKVLVHPPSASRIQLPDGRHLAYLEIGAPADKARFSLMAPHSFLSSRLAGKLQLLEVVYACSQSKLVDFV